MRNNLKIKATSGIESTTVSSGCETLIWFVQLCDFSMTCYLSWKTDVNVPTVSRVIKQKNLETYFIKIIVKFEWKN